MAAISGTVWSKKKCSVSASACSGDSVSSASSSSPERASSLPSAAGDEACPFSCRLLGEAAPRARVAAGGQRPVDRDALGEVCDGALATKRSEPPHQRRQGLLADIVEVGVPRPQHPARRPRHDRRQRDQQRSHRGAVATNGGLHQRVGAVVAAVARITRLTGGQGDGAAGQSPHLLCPAWPADRVNENALGRNYSSGATAPAPSRPPHGSGRPAPARTAPARCSARAVPR